jgi:hypothetical protein
MLPTIPESDFEVMEDNYETSNIKKYVYEIKFEVMPKEEIETIPGKASLIKSLLIIKNAKRIQDKINFFDTNGIQISPDLCGIEQNEIEGRFCMETGGKDDKKLFFACSIQSTLLFTLLFNVIKGRTLNDVKKYGIYAKIHHGGFRYGVNWSPIGFFIKQHPGFVDTKIVRNELLKILGY